jgi:hypothetical protein
MIDLKMLEQKMRFISEIGRDEITFDLDGVPITLRTLTADEEYDARRYAIALADEDDGVGGLLIMERNKRATLAYSIVQIGDMDLRGVTTIETGEVNERGVPVRIPKNVAVRNILDTWPRISTIILHSKFKDLNSRVDVNAARKISYEVKDVDAEIAHLEERLEKLKDQKSKASAEVDDVHGIENRLATLDQKMWESEQSNGTSEAVRAMSKEAPRQEAPRQEAPLNPDPFRTPDRQVRVERPTPQPPRSSEVFDSLENDEAAVRREHERINEMRAARGRTPPHRQALNTMDAVIEETTLTQNDVVLPNPRLNPAPNTAPTNPRFVRK